MANLPMIFAEYETAIHWVFGLIEADVAHPRPRIRWLTEDAVVLQNGWPTTIAEVTPGELTPTLDSLCKVLKHILNRRPILTRVLLNQLDTYLTDAARQPKTVRICTAFSNLEGFQGGADGYLSLVD